MPPELCGLLAGLVSHSSDHAEASGASGAVRSPSLGAGQSALETAALLHELGADVSVVSQEGRSSPGTSHPRRATAVCAVESARRSPASARGGGTSSMRELPLGGTPLSGRDPRQAWRGRCSGLPARGGCGDRIEGHVPVLAGHVLAAAETRGREGPDFGSRRRELRAGRSRWEHVIAATGYRVRLDALDFLASALRSRLETVGGARALVLVRVVCPRTVLRGHGGRE